MKLNYEENELKDYLKDLGNEIKIWKCYPTEEIQ